MWNETFSLRPFGIPNFLVISLRDKDDVGSDDPLGCVVIPLFDLYVVNKNFFPVGFGSLLFFNRSCRIQGIEKEWLCPLQGVKRGLLRIGLLAENFGYPPGIFTGYGSFIKPDSVPTS